MRMPGRDFTGLEEDNLKAAEYSLVLVLHSGVREDADGSVTYCLLGNGLSIVANEEYLTISSTLEPPHSLHPSLAAANPPSSLAAPHSQPSGSSPCFPPPHPSPHMAAAAATTTTTNVSALSLPPDTPTVCSLAHPAQPLTTQPPKTTRHLVHQGLHSGHYKIRPMVPPPRPPPPPVRPITTQVISSLPPCTLTPPPTALPTAHGHVPAREEVEKRHRPCRDDEDEDDVDDEEEESRRKASLC